MRQQRMEGTVMKISKIEIPKKAPETFEELCRLFLPRPIHDEAENAETEILRFGSAWAYLKLIELRR